MRTRAALFCAHGATQMARRSPKLKSSPCGPGAKTALIVLLAIALLFGAAAFFIPQVRERFGSRTETFDPVVAQDSGKGDGVQLVHAKWCGHCKTLLKNGGEWAKLKKQLPGVRFVELDEATIEGKAAIAKGDIKGFPDIRIVKGLETVKRYDSGDRTAAKMKAFVLQYTLSG
jgi:thiol-disulfide isomerase/thioredoxin